MLAKVRFFFHIAKFYPAIVSVVSYNQEMPVPPIHCSQPNPLYQNPPHNSVVFLDYAN